MKKRKLKGYVLPTLYLFIIGLMAIGVTFLSKNLLDKKVESDENYNYSMSVFDESDQTSPTTNEEPVSEKVSMPYTSANVTVAKSFYNKDESNENQENALIYYENTYMPNTGVLYESDEIFDVVSPMDGTVKDIKTDEILGTVLTIEHNSKVTTVYYTLGDTKVNVGDRVTKDQLIATSGTSKLETAKEQTLLFEVYIDGVLTNPNEFYEKTLDELK